MTQRDPMWNLVAIGLPRVAYAKSSHVSFIPRHVRYAYLAAEAEKYEPSPTSPSFSLSCAKIRRVSRVIR